MDDYGFRSISSVKFVRTRYFYHLYINVYWQVTYSFPTSESIHDPVKHLSCNVLQKLSAVDCLRKKFHLRCLRAL